MASKIAILGANGQLGRELMTALHFEALPYTRRDFDFRHTQLISEAFVRDKPDVVINCVAENRVDHAQRKPTEAVEINGFAAGRLANVCHDLDIPLIHFSTDYVFDGITRTPYSEHANTRPINKYGKSKLLGEMAIRLLHHKTTIIRTSGLYTYGGSSSKGGSFIESVIRKARLDGVARVVSDQITCPTYAKDLAEAVVKNLDTLCLGGTYHLTNSGECSWFEFAQEVFRLEGINVPIEPISTISLSTPALRPMYSVLANTYLPRLRPWKEALADYLTCADYHHPCMSPIK
ncbi:MAG: dTDP-4-dehydrorhamnose reductase [Nitrososphaera sp.]|nr:dTDP-4-dehydrorhamnose reductase [Nitrososphaera sp.]